VFFFLFCSTGFELGALHLLGAGALPLEPQLRDICSSIFSEELSKIYLSIYLSIYHLSIIIYLSIHTHTHNEIFFSHLKGNLTLHDSMDKPGRHYSKQNKQDAEDKYCLSHLYMEYKNVKLTETNRMVVSRAVGRRSGEMLA
jgi:hypothetical protein